MCEVNGPVRMTGLRKSVNIMTSPKWRPKASMMILSLKPYWLLVLWRKNTAQAHRREICDFKLWEFPHFYSETESAIKFNPNRSCLTLSRKTSTSSNTCAAEIMEAFLCAVHARSCTAPLLHTDTSMDEEGIYMDGFGRGRHSTSHKVSIFFVTSRVLVTELFVLDGK